MRAAWWWLDRWRKSTARTDMNLAERGAYRELLDECWLRPDGILPPDDRTLAMIACCTLEEWAQVKEKVLARFREVPGGFVNDTALEVKAQSERRARNQKAYRDRQRTDNADDNGTDNKPDSPSPSPSQRTPTENSQSAKPDGFAPAIQEVFDYWHRRTKRTKATKLDPRRTRMLRARLKEESGALEVRVAALKLAVDGAINDPFYAGENERRKRYWELPNIFRNRDRVEELQAAGRRAVAEQEPRQEELPDLGPGDEAAWNYWNEAKRHLAVEVPDHNWNIWFRPTFGHHWEGERNIVLVVAVPSEQHKAQLREVYQDRIKGVVGDTLVKLVVGRVG
jgi:uncharacterized protein YdaU (DUF1376 family)